MASLSYIQPHIDAIHATAEALDVPSTVVDALQGLLHGKPALLIGSSMTHSHSVCRPQHPKIPLNFSPPTRHHIRPIQPLSKKTQLSLLLSRAPRCPRALPASLRMHQG